MITPILLVAALQQSDTVKLSERLCSPCGVTLERVATLGDNDGPGALSFGAVLAMDARGRFLLAHRAAQSQITVFTSEGKYSQTVGRQGAGPGEYQNIWSIAPSDRGVLVYDAKLARRTVLDLDLKVVASYPAAERAATMLFRNDGSAIVAAIVPTTDAIGYTLHKIDARGARVKSFAGPNLPYREDMRELFIRSLSAGLDAGRYWVANRREYVFSHCAFETDACHVFLRPAAWFEAPRPSALTTWDMGRQPPFPLLASVSQDDPRYVWTVSIVPDDRWKSALKPINATEYSVTNFNQYYDSIVERIDLVTNRVVVSKRFDQRIYPFIAPGIASYYREDDAGIPRIEIVRFRMADHP